MTATTPPSRARLRLAMLDDHAGVLALLQRQGLSDIQDPAVYRDFWTSNPHRPQNAPITTGWVLETADGKIVGCCSSVPLGYEYNGRAYTAGAAHTIAVDPEHRYGSLELFGRYFLQPGVDLLMMNTSSEIARKIYFIYHAQDMPAGSCEQALFWLSNRREFIGSALRLRHVPGAGVLQYPAALALQIDDCLRHRRGLPRGRSPAKRIEQFDDRFDDLWEALRKRPNHLLAVRNRAALAWHYKVAQMRGRVAIIVLEHNGRLAGFLVLLRRDRKDVSLGRYAIADLQLREDNREHLGWLMRAALQSARDDGASVLETSGFDSFKHAALEALGPRRRPYPSPPFQYKIINPELQAELPRIVWDPTAYDGDAGF